MATPSLAMVPSGYKDGTLYSVLPNNAGGDFDVTRGSLATRVNKNGLIEPVGTLGADVVLNGDFEETGADQVLNGDFSQESSELIVNGDFATDSDWVKATGWTISGGSANTDGVSGRDIKQNNITVVGKSYKYSFTVSNSGVGVIEGRFRDKTSGIPIINFSSEGTYEGYFTAIGTFASFVNLSGNTASYSIDNVSVVEVGQNWTLGTSWSIGEDKANYDSSLGTSNIISSTLNITNGKSYKLKFNVVSGIARLAFTTEGSQALFRPNGNGINNFSVGEYYFYLVAENSASALKIFAYDVGGGQDCSITNISLEEVGQEWTLTDGCSITAQGARILSDGTYQEIVQVSALVIGDTYEIEYEITESVSGTISFNSNFDNLPLKSTVGVHKFYGVAQNSNTLTIKRGSSPTDVTINNIKVKRLNGDDTPRIDYTDGGCPVLLTEPQSTNLIPHSNDFSGANWVVLSDITITPNTTDVLSPSGFYDANKVVSTNSTRGFYSTGLSVTSDATRTIYLKGSVGGESVVLRDGGGFGGSATYILTTEWARYELKTTNDGNVYQGLFVDDISVGTIYAWGAQLEELSYATSLIPTYGAVRTRLQDTVTGAGTSSDFNDSEGVLFVEARKLLNGVESQHITISDGSNDNLVMIQWNNTINRIQFYVRGSGGTYDIVQANSIPQTDMNKIALSWDSTNYYGWVNGVQVGTSTVSNSPIGLSELGFSQNSSDPFFGKTSQVQVFKTALTSAELITLTTI